MQRGAKRIASERLGHRYALNRVHREMVFGETVIYEMPVALSPAMQLRPKQNGSYLGVCVLNPSPSKARNRCSGP